MPSILARNFAVFLDQCPQARVILDSADIPSAQAAEDITALGWPVSSATLRRARRRALTAADSGSSRNFTAGDREALHGKLDELLDQAPAAVKSMRVAAWDGMVRNDLGEPELVRQYGIRLESAPIEPAWPVVAPAAPVQVTVQATPAAAQERSPADWKTCLVLPDIQCGYYRDAAGELVPTHDLDAIDVAMQIGERLQPDEILIGGDALDLPEASHYRLSPAFADTTQTAVDWIGQFLATLRALHPAACINWLAGNHEERLPNYLLDNARAAYGLRQSGSGPPVLSVPFLTRCSEYGVNYIPGYPASVHYWNDHIRAVHGDKVNSSGSTVHRYLDEPVSSVSFHIHRIEWGSRTRQTRHGSRTIVSASPGCLCKTGGGVPSTKGGTDLSGVPVRRSEDWQLGLGILCYQPGDGPFDYQQVIIHQDDSATWALFEGAEIRSR